MCASPRSGIPRHRNISALIASRRAAASPRCLAIWAASPATPIQSATRSRINCAVIWLVAASSLGPNRCAVSSWCRRRLPSSLFAIGRAILSSKLMQRSHLPMRNSNAPPIAFRKLSYPRRFSATHQCHISRRKLDGPAELGCLHTATGCENQKQVTTRLLRGNFASSIHMQGRTPHAPKCHKRQLAGRHFAGHVITHDGHQIGANPSAAEFFPPGLVARPAGLPRVLPTNDSRGHGTARRS